MPGAVTVEETTASGEERNTVETNIRNKVQGIEQELPLQEQISNMRERNDNPRRENNNDKCRLCGQKGPLVNDLP